MSLTLEDFTVAYGDLKAVDGLSLSFPAGATGLLGPNGAGKSSLIKGLLGLVPPRSGTARILGHDIRTERDTIRQLIGYMPEDDSLIPGLTGFEMVRFAGELSGMTRVDAMQRAHEVLFLLGLEEARYREVESYSVGMKQRIKLAQALVHDPQLLFLDEPTSGMDPKGRQEMLDLITGIAAGGEMSIVVASHILVDVERTCERVVVMHRGRVLEEDRVADLRGGFAGVHTVRVEGDTDRFIRRLQEQGVEVRPGERHTLEVELPEDMTTDVILETARETGVVLRRLVSSVRSLEDVFVHLLGEGYRADL
ncbi:MAG: ABC transporter ATP-binding protein [bacterium]